MEGALPTIAYNRGGGGGIGAVIFDKPSIDPLEALNLTIQREQQENQQKAVRQERQLERTYQMLKDVNFDVSGVYDYDLPMFRERTEKLNAKAGSILQKYANKPELQGEFLNEWQRDVLGEYNDLKYLMENSKNDKQILQKTIEKAQTNKSEMADDYDAKIAEFNLTPVGQKNKDGLTRQQLAAQAVIPTFNENKYITDVATKLSQQKTYEVKKRPDGSEYKVVKESIAPEDAYMAAQQLYTGKDRFQKQVNQEFDALATSQNPSDVALHKNYVDKAEKLSQQFGYTITPEVAYTHDFKLQPYLKKDKEDAVALKGANRVVKQTSAELGAKKMQQQADVMYELWTNFRKGDPETMKNLVVEGAVIKNGDGSYEADLGTGWFAPPAVIKKIVGSGDSAREDVERIERNMLLGIKQNPDGTTLIKTSATVLDNMRNGNNEWITVSPKYLEAVFNSNGGKTYGGNYAYQKAKENYDRKYANKEVKNVREAGFQKVADVVIEDGKTKYVPVQKGDNKANEQVKTVATFDDYVAQFEAVKKTKATPEIIEQLRVKWNAKTKK